MTAIEHSDLSKEEAMAFGASPELWCGLGAGGEEGAEAGALAGASQTESMERLDARRPGTWPMRYRRGTRPRSP